MCISNGELQARAVIEAKALPSYSETLLRHSTPALIAFSAWTTPA